MYYIFSTKYVDFFLFFKGNPHITAMQGVTIIQIITQINATIAIIVFRY